MTCWSYIFFYLFFERIVPNWPKAGAAIFRVGGEIFCFVGKGGIFFLIFRVGEVDIFLKVVVELFLG